MAQLSVRLNRRFEYALEVLDICRDVEASLYIIASRYATIDCNSPETFIQRFTIFANTPPALDIVYRLSNTLQRFAAIYFKAGHPLAETAQTLNVLKSTFHYICGTLTRHWIPLMVYEGLGANFQRTPPYRIICQVAGLERINANDITTSLTEALTHLLNAGSKLPNDFITLRRFLTVFIIV